MATLVIACVALAVACVALWQVWVNVHALNRDFDRLVELGGRLKTLETIEDDRK